MLRRFSVNFALFSMILDALSVALGLSLAMHLRPLLNELPWFRIVEAGDLVPSILFVFFPLIWVVIFSIISIYDGRKFLRVSDEFSILTLAVLLSAVSSAGILYFSYRQVSRALFLIFVLLAYLFCLSWRILARFYFRTQKLPSGRMRYVIVIGAGSLGQKVRDQLLASASPDLTFVGFLDSDILPSQGISLLGGLNEVRDVLGRHSVTDVVIALPHSAYHQMGDLVQAISDMPVQVWVALGFFDLALYRTSIEEFEGIPMLDLRASAIDEYQHMIKRAFDLMFGVIALLLALPLMVLSAIMIYFDDGMPILFKQKRVGANGKLFDMLKFRTMVRNAEQLQSQVERRDGDGNIIHKMKEDPRITRTGRFLRRFSLDELPQFINVLYGDMSLVGPRPELPSLVDRYQPWQRKRFAVPPGVTGWWQVNGRSDKPMHLHTEDDMYYIQNYSPWLDILILVKTVWVVIAGRGAY